MWTNSEEERNLLLKEGKSDKVDFVIPKDIVISTDMKEVVDKANLIMIAIPAKFLDTTSKELKNIIIVNKLFVLPLKVLNNILVDFYMMLLEIILELAILLLFLVVHLLLILCIKYLLDLLLLLKAIMLRM